MGNNDRIGSKRVKNTFNRAVININHKENRISVRVGIIQCFVYKQVLISWNWYIIFLKIVLYIYILSLLIFKYNKNLVCNKCSL